MAPSRPYALGEVSWTTESGLGFRFPIPFFILAVLGFPFLRGLTLVSVSVSVSVS